MRLTACRLLSKVLVVYGIDESDSCCACGRLHRGAELHGVVAELNWRPVDTDLRPPRATRLLALAGETSGSAAGRRRLR